MKTKTTNGAATLNGSHHTENQEKGLPKQTLAKHNILPPKTEQNTKNQTPNTKQSAKYETSIAQTLAHGETAVNYLITFGAPYNPSNPDLTIANLQAKNAQGNQLVTAVQTKKQASTLEINNRQSVYGNLKPLVTRVINEFEACGASKKAVTDARHYVNKIRGHRIIAIKPDETNQNHISACQTTFTEQVQHLNGLIAVVSAEPRYNPNVADLTVAALEAKRDAMIASNQTAGTAQAQLGAARLERNHFFNDAYTGYVDTYMAVKRSVKAIFGATSPEYRQISGLNFMRIRG